MIIKLATENTTEKEVRVPSFYALGPGYLWIKSEEERVILFVDNFSENAEIHVCRSGGTGFDAIAIQGEETTEQEFNEQLAIAQQRIAEVLQTKTTEVSNEG